VRERTRGSACYTGVEAAPTSRNVDFLAPPRCPLTLHDPLSTPARASGLLN